VSEPPQEYQGPGPNSEAFDPKQHRWDGIQWWTADGSYWWDGTRWKPRGAPSQPPPAAAWKPRPPGYWRDFWLGFVGVIAANIVLLVVYSQLTAATTGGPGSLLNLAPWVLNLGALVAFGIIRPRVMLGMLLAYGIAFGLAVLAGIFLAVICFGSGGIP
jgi:hypothetical protein